MAHPRWVSHAYVYGQIPGENPERVAINMYYMDIQRDRITMASDHMGEKTYGMIQNA